jgi:hypothetical protein
MSSKQVSYSIYVSPSSVKVKIKAKNKLLWFDSDTNKMLEFEGGKLVPVFDLKQKKLVPKVEDVFYTSYQTESQEHEIKEWIKHHGARYGAEIDEEETNRQNIVVKVDKNNTSFFEYAIDRKGFRYEKV